MMNYSTEIGLQFEKTTLSEISVMAANKLTIIQIPNSVLNLLSV